MLDQVIFHQWYDCKLIIRDLPNNLVFIILALRCEFTSDVTTSSLIPISSSISPRVPAQSYVIPYTRCNVIKYRITRGMCLLFYSCLYQSTERHATDYFCDTEEFCRLYKVLLNTLQRYQPFIKTRHKFNTKMIYHLKCFPRLWMILRTEYKDCQILNKGYCIRGND